MLYRIKVVYAYSFAKTVKNSEHYTGNEQPRYEFLSLVLDKFLCWEFLFWFYFYIFD